MKNQRSIVRKISAIVSILCIILVSVSGIRAQEGSPAMPAQVTKLRAFIGDWHGTGTFTMKGTPHRMTFNHLNEPVADGWGIRTMESSKIEGMPDFNAIHTIGYDPGSDLVHMFTVSSYGECQDHRGRWIDEKTVVLQYEGITDAKPMVKIFRITVDNPDQYSFTLSTYIGGELAVSAESVMKRK